MNRQVVKALKPKDRIKLWNIAVGDTVKVIVGPSKGTIGKVQECLKDQNKIIVSGVNVVKKMLPKFLVEKSRLEGQKFEYAAPIHYSNVQLVGELPFAADPRGQTRRVEIKRINQGKTFYKKDKKLLTWRRWVPGENVFLPWPRHESNKVDGPMDTKLADVSATTYLETLHQSPIPLDMQHELRNKYSKFRRDQFDTRRSGDMISDVDGIEFDDASSSAEEGNLPTASESSTRSRKTGGTTLAGLDQSTIDILAEAMSRPSTRPPQSNIPV